MREGRRDGCSQVGSVGDWPNQPLYATAKSGPRLSGTTVDAQNAKMTTDDKIIQSGPFNGKRIEFAPTVGIAVFREVAEVFLRRIFDFEPGEYLISDEFESL